MKKNKERIFTFKTDEKLARQLEAIPNRSEFIRRALNAALEQDCPLCKGTGVFSKEQQKHWQHFLSLHTLERCDECDSVHFVCQPDAETGIH